MNRSASLVAVERPKFLKSVQEFISLPDRILQHGEIAVGVISDWEDSVGEISVGEIAVGEVVTGEIVLGKMCWGNDLTPILIIF